ncbi:MAG: amino acid carrier protein [Clostridium sp.]
MAVVEVIHRLMWGPWLLFLFLGVGIFYTLRLKGFQVFYLTKWWNATIGTLGRGEADSHTHFATACTALAATVGTGNIAGVATAIAAGGPGTIFWMWISACLGMVTAYAETFLGIKYRYRKSDGHYVCGPFVYLERGLHNRSMGVIYACFCVMASLGMGSMVQSHSIAESLSYSFSCSPTLCAVMVTSLAMLVIVGGIKRISETATRLVPCSAGLYMVFCGIVIFTFYDRIPRVVLGILEDAFTFKSAAGGAAGYVTGKALRYGMARGIFSNEAGLGSLAVLHGDAEQTSPREQGLWAVFEVFFDTMISCTLTALVILCVMGTESASLGQSEFAVQAPGGSAVVAYCFSRCFGRAGGYLIAVIMTLFAFATIIAWFYLGRQAVVYLTEEKKYKRKILKIYTFLYLNAVFWGCMAKLRLVWSLSDIFNGLMAIPNLIGLLWLSKEVESPFAGE